MEAKDTVMSEEQIAEAGELPHIPPYVSRLLEAQAEISFKAGIREEKGRIYALIFNFGLKAFLLEIEGELDKKCFGKPSLRNGA